jgi:tRNA splicing endonuclease
MCGREEEIKGGCEERRTEALVVDHGFAFGCELRMYEDNGIKYREYRALFYEDH